MNIIYHLAGYADVAGATRNPEVAFRTDVLGTFNLLNSARINGASRIIYVSTARVYGDPQYEPQDEDHPLTPKEFYGADKLIGETYCKVFGSTYGLPTVIIRPFSVYGEGQVPKKGSLSGVVSIFARNAMEGRGLQITGDGEQAKDFIHIDDTVDALMLSGVNQDCIGTAINIGSGEKVSINQLAELVIQKTGCTSKIVHTPQVGENVNNLADISKARKILGFSPTITLEEGVTRYIHWLKEVRPEIART
jgi:UDP-glucose 4-epimerase